MLSYWYISDQQSSLLFLVNRISQLRMFMKMNNTQPLQCELYVLNKTHTIHSNILHMQPKHKLLLRLQGKKKSEKIVFTNYWKLFY